MCAAVKSACAVPPQVDVPRFLEAIELKENMPQSAIGRHGERSIYCITENVWREQMPDWPFTLCTEDPFYARICAIKQVNWLANELAKAGYPANEFTLAAAWHHGLKGYLALAGFGGDIPYAGDVKNLYGDIERKP